MQQLYTVCRCGINCTVVPLILQERYRSNSLDSILVSDHLKAGGHILPPKRSSAVEIKVLPPASATPREEDDASSKLGQQQFLKRQQLKNNLEKRPTFDSLDKRKSWSVDVSSARSGGAGQPKQHQSMERVGGGQLRNARGQTLQQVQQQQKKLLATSKGSVNKFFSLGTVICHVLHSFMYVIILYI